MTIPIYKAEAELRDLIVADNKIIYASKLLTGEIPVQPYKLPRITASANPDQLDLFYMKSILVSSGWNLNDEVFDKKELWAARASAEDKPLNVGHNVTDVIGHMTDVWPVDEDNKAIAFDTSVDELPDKFHLMVNSVIYRCIQSDAEERIAKIIGEIGEGKWYVSMEALFSEFDYALLYTDGTHKIVARNEKTAFLSKHLRCYKGTGSYNGAKIGRVPRNIIFSGKGLVENPANPDSKIFASIITLNKNLGYITSSSEIQGDKMSVELENQLKAALDEIKNLKATIADFNEKSFKDKISQLEAALAAKTELVSVVEGKLTASAQEVVTLKQNAESLNKSVAELTEKVNTFEGERKIANRIKVLAEATKLPEDKVKNTVETLSTLNDEAFGQFVEQQKTIAAVTETPKVEKTTASAVIDSAKPNEGEKPQVVAGVKEIEVVKKAVAAFLDDEIETNKVENK